MREGSARPSTFSPFQWIVIGLLGSLVILQLLTLQKLPDPPVTAKALRENNQRALRDSIPLVRIVGTVDVSGSVDVANTVDVNVSEPLGVEAW